MEDNEYLITIVLQGTLTDVGLVLSNHSNRFIIEGLTHELLGNLTSAKPMKLLGHVDCRALAYIEDVTYELLELGVDDRGIDRQLARSNLGRQCLASTDKTVTVRRGCRKRLCSVRKL